MNRAGCNWPFGACGPKHGVLKKLTMAVVFLLCYCTLVTSPVAATLLVLQVGMEGPEYSLSLPEGGKKASRELKGDKLTVLVFWASWIKKSEALLARMEKLLTQYQAQGLAVVGINVDEQKVSPQTLDKVTEVRDRLRLKYPMLVDPGLTAFRDYGIIALPTTVILDQNRVIKYELSGYPLVGAEAMADFIGSTLQGKQPLVQVKPHYQPSKSALGFYNMGKTSLKSKLLSDQAELWFKKAAQADPGFILPHLSLGRIYSDQGETALAQAEFQAVLAKEPGHAVALCELGILLVEQGKRGEGLALFNTARTSEDSYPPCFYYAGYALGQEGKSAEAGTLFAEAERLNPADYRVFLYRGKLSEQQKDWKQAAEWYGRALGRIVEVP